MVNKILTKELLAKRRVEANAGILSGIYDGKIGSDGSALFADKEGAPILNSKGMRMESVVAPANAAWAGTAPYYDHWNKIEDQLKKLKAQVDRKTNIAQFPDDYYTLVDMMRLDVTRRRLESMDFTDQIAREVVNPAFSRSIRLDELRPYTGAFLEINGQGESVPLIQQKSGETGTVDMHIYGLGHERSLEDELYNTQIYSLEKVLTAVNRAHTGARNVATIGQLVQATIDGTWNSAQQVPASIDTSYELALFLTLRNAIRHLLSLLDPQTLLEIDYSRIALVVGSNVIAFDLNRILNGQLAMSGSSAGVGTQVINVEKLPIDEIWIYKGDVLYIGPERVVYPGVPTNKAYLVVTSASDNGNLVATKRGLTMEMGRGDVMTLAREKRAWYFVQGQYNNEFFGATGGCSAGTGFCVEIDLPVFDEQT